MCLENNLLESPSNFLSAINQVSVSGVFFLEISWPVVQQSLEWASISSPFSVDSSQSQKFDEVRFITWKDEWKAVTELQSAASWPGRGNSENKKPAQMQRTFGPPPNVGKALFAACEVVLPFRGRTGVDVPKRNGYRDGFPFLQILYGWDIRHDWFFVTRVVKSEISSLSSSSTKHTHHCRLQQHCACDLTWDD